jgi:Rieske Fe-S protein
LSIKDKGNDMNEMTAGHEEARREFLKTCLTSLTGITMIAALAPLVESCSSNPASAITPGFSSTYDVSSLTADNTGMLTATNGADGTPIIIVRNSATSYTALSSRCPHEGCPCSAPQNRVISCPCHGSRFDLTGKVLNGPATSALYTYATTYDASTKKLTVTS